MAETFNVRLKDGSGNVLHPETDWSVVQNKPSIKIDSESEYWFTTRSYLSIGAVDGRISASGMHFYKNGKTTVIDSATKYLEANLADYPIRSLTPAPAPSANPTASVGKASFGLIEIADSSQAHGMETIYAVVYISGKSMGTHYYLCYLTTGTWVSKEISYQSGTLVYTIDGVVYTLFPLVNREIQ